MLAQHKHYLSNALLFLLVASSADSAFICALRTVYGPVNCHACIRQVAPVDTSALTGKRPFH